MGEKKYTSALIGCGRIGYSLGLDKRREQPASHTMAMNENSRITLIAGCDIDDIALKTWHEANRKTCVYKDSANLYARHRADIVCVAVNEENHLKEAVEAICSKPKLVILEKPVALNLEEGFLIKAASEKNNVKVLVNHERRFQSDYILAKQYMSQIGKLESIHASLQSGMCVYSRDSEKNGSCSLLHDGTHLVDAVLYFLEEDNKASELVQKTIYRKEARGSGLLNLARDEDNKTVHFVNSILHDPIVHGIVTDEKGAVRQVSCSYSTEKCANVEITISGRAKYFGFDIEICGTEGKICIGNGYLKFYKREVSPYYTGFYSLKRDYSPKIPKKTMYFTSLYQNAVEYLDGKGEIKSTLAHGLNALAILDEIKSSLRK